MHYPRQFSIFVLLFFLKPISSCLDDQCRELAFPASLFFVGERLINHVIRTIKVLDQDNCELQCYLEHNCVSMNFDITGTHYCDLNNATHKEHEKDLVTTPGYLYHGTNNACGKAPCKNNATCQSGFTRKRYRCLCSSGFTGHDCERDINECKAKTHKCDVNAVCNNTKGSYNCTCKAGYTGDGHKCKDIDECAQDIHNCSKDNALCNNTEGSFNCTCKPGFIGDGHDCTEFSITSTILSKNGSFLAHLQRFLAPAVGNDSRWLLCYRASLHGWAAQTFHSRCDGKKNTVTVIQKDIYVFGGYTDIPWADCPPGARTKKQGRCCVFPFEYKTKSYHKCTKAGYFVLGKWWCSLDGVYDDDWAICDSTPKNEYRNTDKAFIYSLRNKEGLKPFKSMVTDASGAIYASSSNGPTFGKGHDIYIANDRNINSYSNLGHSYFLPKEVKDQDTILAGSFNFIPDEVEVFYLA